MTLILAALCKNGVCVCADTRYQQKFSNGLIENKDSNNKIYKFNSNDISLIIYNHGINNINKKDWKVFCSDYETSNRWKGKEVVQVAEDFKLFIKDDIQKELQKNTLEHTVGFVLCGKTIYDGNFDSYELWWNHNEYSLIPLKNESIIRSGDGKKCLEEYLSNNYGISNKGFWESKNTNEIKKELEKLFIIAVQEKKKLNHDNPIREIFSDDYIIECIN